ncbi:hypothetical protein DFH06DRAFT_1152759, partial [Mycena polygramma]
MSSSKKIRNRSSLRSREPASVAGSGAHFTSPPKKRDARSHQPVVGFGQAQRMAMLRARIAARKNPNQASAQALNPAHNNPEPVGDVEMEDWVDESDIMPHPPYPPNASPVPVPIPSSSSNRTTAQRLCAAWDLLLPELEGPYAEYQLASYAQRPSAISTLLRHECTASFRGGAGGNMQLHAGHCSPRQTWHLPMSPTKPKTGVSIDLLDVYRALFERSCDAITALAAALRTIYDRRGFFVVSQQDRAQLAKDPFRAGLQNAVQWYSNLRSRLQNKLDQALLTADISLFPPALALPEVAIDEDVTSAADASAQPPDPSDASPDPVGLDAGREDPPPTSTDHIPEQSVPPVLTPGRADRLLRERCPACFGLEEWGRPLD